jgi:hypothetical protein
MITIPGMTQEKTSWTIRFGSGGIQLPDWL